MSTLGDDLVLLSVWQGGGRVSAPHVTGVGLMGAELVRLAAAGRIDIASGRITVLGEDAGPLSFGMKIASAAVVPASIASSRPARVM